MIRNYSERWNLFSNVERSFIKESGIENCTTAIPYIAVDNVLKLGLLASLRFLEWASQNPEGVVSLPTGKTPEYFINYTQSILSNWGKSNVCKLLDQYGLDLKRKPDLSKLQFVQMDEFYPIDSKQHNSFCNYVKKYYVEGLGLDIKRAMFIDSNEIELADGLHFSKVFPNSTIDLSLRYRMASTSEEEIQQRSIMMIDNWCSNYELQIREKGGIGFFLSGIGPDGHIAFNTRGSDHFSSTRLTSTNFETQAVSADDLGGIEVSRSRLVITVGLQTITYNPKAVAIVFIAGESKAAMVKQALENKPSNVYPASALQKLDMARFYLTQGAAVQLKDSVDRYYMMGDWSEQKTERAVIDLCNRIRKYGSSITLDDLLDDQYCRLIPNLNEDTVQSVIDSVKAKIAKGMAREENQVIYHTGPHHDDIMLGIMPYTNRQVRAASNDIHFSVMTSGFHSVGNQFVIKYLDNTRKFLSNGKIQMVEYPDFFDEGYKYKWIKDVHHYLDNVAAGNSEEMTRGVCHRIVRSIVLIWGIKSVDQLCDIINSIIHELANCYDGGINSPKVQRLKGMIREFEEELVWSHYGVAANNIHHMRLGFYQTTGKPDMARDIQPIVNEFKKYKPSQISLAMDPEGSGPDTHYKVLQAVAAAVEVWSKDEDLSKLKIIGYRNVWFRYHPSEAELIVPVSLNALAILDKSFSDCYLSQVNASFPSYELNGKFSAVAQKHWVEQLEQIQLLLGKNYFYQNEHPLLRATHGLLYLRQMDVSQFLEMARNLEGVFKSL